MLQRIITKVYGPPGDMAELRALTKKLPPWGNRWRGNGDRIVDVGVDAGRSLLLGLQNDNEITVAISVSDAGTRFGWHSHEQVELIFQYIGVQVFEFPDRTVMLKPGMELKIKGGESHKVTFPSDSRSIVIMYPAAAYFPGGGRFSDQDEFDAAIQKR